ncbi:hypothetical protein POX_e06742 [Penicillium oxalicum]|uniref:Uncharacterized protein n=1 Tax=Penicillium oxalicum (strain 114-2 / CGMCC 5302) TaxID=933388 RepID=S7ZGI9_PENO1|nr:hypothetical protein POX_e06742 [Penicillium oxalicum]EPS27761.1 hypothetical protein PDE_02705 [Penicillium oxalicum 114-2]KAI2788721.1 hypothetical protein POX_e06742 [Penicillium oxalicum]
MTSSVHYDRPIRHQAECYGTIGHTRLSSDSSSLFILPISAIRFEKAERRGLIMDSYGTEIIIIVSPTTTALLRVS